jgi:hypothetical protein
MENFTLNLTEAQVVTLYHALLDAFALAELDNRDADRDAISAMIDKLVRK